MTVRYTADVFCDRCGNWTHGVTGDKPTGLAGPALRAAKRAGWSRNVKSPLLDLCPDCLEEGRRPNPEHSPANAG